MYEIILINMKVRPRTPLNIQHGSRRSCSPPGLGGCFYCDYVFTFISNFNFIW